MDNRYEEQEGRVDEDEEEPVPPGGDVLYAGKSGGEDEVAEAEGFEMPQAMAQAAEQLIVAQQAAHDNDLRQAEGGDRRSVWARKPNLAKDDLPLSKYSRK